MIEDPQTVSPEDDRTAHRREQRQGVGCRVWRFHRLHQPCRSSSDLEASAVKHIYPALKWVSKAQRWLRRRWRAVSTFHLDVQRGAHNFWVFRKAVWYFPAWDYVGLLELMEIAALEMRESHRLGITTDHEKRERELTVLAELCRRLREGNHIHGKDYPKNAERDIEALGATLKHVRCWWN